MKPKPKFLTSHQNIALSFVFECTGEERYNRTYEEYMRIAAALPNLKELLFRVNELLREKLELYGPPYEICRFKAGDEIIQFEPFPASISRETLRTALIVSGMRNPQRRRSKL